MEIKYSLNNCIWYASKQKTKLPIVAKKEADILKKLEWKTFKGILMDFHLTAYYRASAFSSDSSMPLQLWIQ